jgi:transcriptional regulator with XRE-family HTH domain
MALNIFVMRRRAKLGLSIRGLAKRVGCSPTHILDIEKGRSANPTIDFLASLGGALGVSVIQIVRATMKTDSSLNESEKP